MDNVLYLVGLVCSGAALVGALLGFVAFKAKSARLEKKLSLEYGERKKRVKRQHE